MSKFSTFEELKTKRKEMVRSMKENDAFEGIKNLLTELYPDKAHFIYELLQNAEDMEATEVFFGLNDSQLVFEHNGKRRDFTLEDISAITNVGQSPKRDDPTSIGQFGVGFKAVYAYTNTPEVHSGEYDFKIVDMLIPDDIGIEKTAKKGFTRFVFPLGTEIKTCDTAISEIEKGLSNLDNNAILFLSHIKKIRYQLSNGRFGSIAIEPNNLVPKLHDITVYSTTLNQPQITHFLKFDKEILIDIKGKQELRFISIAYKVDLENATMVFDSSTQGKVFIYFPAEKEPSRLRFHINAPFASTVARDSVRDCPENNDLVIKIAELVKDSLIWLKENHLWNRTVYSILPHSRDFLNDTNNIFKKIYENVKKAFKTYELIHVTDDSFVLPPEVVQLGSSIAKVFSLKDFKMLEDHKYILAAQPNSNEYYFFLDLGIAVIDEKKFIRLLKTRSYQLCEIFKLKEALWFNDFYSLMLEIWKDIHFIESEFANIKMILSDKGTLCSACEKIYLKSDYSPQNIKNPLYVNPVINEDKKSHDFLANVMKIKEMSAKEDYLEEISGDTESAISAMLEILEEYKQAKDKKLFSEKYCNEKIFITKHSDSDELQRDTAQDTCWSSVVAFFYPKTKYIQTTWGVFTTTTPVNYKVTLALNIYKEAFEQSVFSLFKDMFIRLGGKIFLDIIENTDGSSLQSNPDWVRWEETTKFKKTNVRCVDFIIPELSNIEQIQKNKLYQESALIWDLLSTTEGVDKCYGFYFPSESAYSNFKQHIKSGNYWEGESTLVYRLKTTKWIPNKMGEFKLPCEVSADDLYETHRFIRLSPILKAIGFGDKARQTQETINKVKEIAGLTVQQQKALELILQEPELADALIKQKSEREKKGLLDALKDQNKNQSPVEDNDTYGQDISIKNPDKRQEKIQKIFEEGLATPTKRFKALHYTYNTNTSEGEKRFIEEQYNGTCQICEESAIIKHDGDIYFEAVNIVGTKDLKEELLTNIDVGWNTLCLCPNCAAKFKYCSKNLNGLPEQVKNINVASGSNQPIHIQILLQEKPTEIKFTPRHFLALKKAFEVYTKYDK